MKKYILYLKQLHNTAFTWIIIPDAESTASAKSTGATSVSLPLQQSMVGARATATHDKSETTRVHNNIRIT